MKKKKTKSKKPYPQTVKDEARGLWMRGFGFTRIVRLPHMPNRRDTLEKWCKEENWIDMLGEVKEKAREKFIEKISDEFSDEDVEQMRLLLKVGDHIEKNLDKWGLIHPQDLNLLSSALDKNVKGRRLIQGEVTEKREISGEIGISWESIIYATAEDSPEDNEENSETNS